jgi:hypothetical protein
MDEWMELCKKASTEQDPQKLIALTTEINRLLREKQERAEGDTKSAKANRMDCSNMT